MEVPNPSKMQKLTITGVNRDKTRTPIKGQVFEAMFNPPQYSISYRNNTRVQKTQNAQTNAVEAAGQEPQVFSVRLVLDSTGVVPMDSTSNTSLANQTVMERIRKFLTICRDTKENLHEPHLLQIQWGEVNFYGRMQSVQVSYTLFDASGNPLRAELEAEFVAETEIIKLSSPDLTHTRTVKAGDTLPLLAKEIYGSSRYYLFVAEANELDDFRQLSPGSVLYFPPLTTKR